MSELDEHATHVECAHVSLSNVLASANAAENIVHLEIVLSHDASTSLPQRVKRWLWKRYEKWPAGVRAVALPAFAWAGRLYRCGRDLTRTIREIPSTILRRTVRENVTAIGMLLLRFPAWVVRMVHETAVRLLRTALKPVWLLRSRLVNLLYQRRVFMAVVSAIQFVLLPVYIPVLLWGCWRAGRQRRERLVQKLPPRLVWGPYPNQSVTEIARALKPAGLQCDSIVYYNFGRIWKADTFTYCLANDLAKYSFAIGQVLKVIYYHYKVFLRVVRDYDIVHGFFYGGFLRDTLFERFEVQLLHLAGCKQINTTIGGDVAQLTDIESHVIRQGINDMYPESASTRAQDLVGQWIRYWSTHSDFIICQCSYMIDALPRWDALVTQYFPIDTDYWQGTDYRDADGRNAPVRIGHSPNHRPLKGTNFLIKAVNELRQEGLKIELVLLENHQNTLVRDILREVDIVVADLVLQGYAVMATEGCSLGKPVVQDISDPHYNRVFKLYTGLDEAPFVSTPLEDVKEHLRALVTQPALRREIGERSRAYALKYHSFEANRRFWEWVYEYVWYKRRPRVAFYHPDWPIETLTSLNQVQLTEPERQLKESVDAILAPHRGAQGLDRLAFYPFNEDTAPLVHSLIRARCVHSDDYLVADDGAEIPASASNYTQAVIHRSALEEYALDKVCRLPASALTADNAKVLPFKVLHESAHSVRDNSYKAA